MSSRNVDVTYRTKEEAVPFVIERMIKEMVRTAIPGILLE